MQGVEHGAGVRRLAALPLSAIAWLGQTSRDQTQSAVGDAHVVSVIEIAIVWATESGPIASQLKPLVAVKGGAVEVVSEGATPGATIGSGDLGPTGFAWFGARRERIGVGLGRGADLWLRSPGLR